MVSIRDTLRGSSVHCLHLCEKCHARVEFIDKIARNWVHRKKKTSAGHHERCHSKSFQTRSMYMLGERE